MEIQLEYSAAAAVTVRDGSAAMGSAPVALGHAKVHPPQTLPGEGATDRLGETVDDRAKGRRLGN